MPKELMTNRPFPFSSDIHMSFVKIILKHISESSPHLTFSDFKRMRTEIFIFTLIYSKIFKFEINTGTVNTWVFWKFYSILKNEFVKYIQLEYISCLFIMLTILHHGIIWHPHGNPKTCRYISKTLYNAILLSFLTELIWVDVAASRLILNSEG